MKTGTLQQASKSTGIDNPSFLALSDDKKFLYAVNELKDFEGMAQGAISAFRVNPDTGSLTLLNRQGTGGADPCHVAVGKDGTHVYVANYSGGSIAVFPCLQDGKLGARSQLIQHTGSSVNPDRQAGPHAHSLVFSPNGKHAFVSDLGMDKLMRYDIHAGTLSPARPACYNTAPGDGPRCCEFSEDGRFCYVINELASTISVLEFNESSNDFTLRQTVPTVMDAGFSGENTAADIHLLPGGSFLYGSNRGHNSLVVYKRDKSTGRLELISNTPCGGEIPRSFVIDPTGSYILAANQNTNNIVVFAIDPKEGTLEKVEDKAAPTPVCVQIVQWD